MTRFKIAGSNSGILVGGRVLSNSHQGCYRKIALRNAGIQEPLTTRSRLTFAVGRAVEGVFAEEHPTFKINTRLPEMPLITENVALGVEMDGYDVSTCTAYELKSVSSTDKLKDIFVHRHYKLDNAIQLALYMLTMDSDEMPIKQGILQYVCTIYDKFTVAKKEHRFSAGDTAEFKAIWDGNNFLIDGERTPITQAAIVSFLEYGAWVLETRPKVSEIVKPLNEDGESVACMWCHWRDQCQNAEIRGYTLDQFVESCLPF